MNTDDALQRIGDRVFRLIGTGHNSTRYGPCEVCGEHCSEVHLQVEGVISHNPDPIISDARFVTLLHPGEHVTYAGVKASHRFGHASCLIAQRGTP